MRAGAGLDTTCEGDADGSRAPAAGLCIPSADKEGTSLRQVELKNHSRSWIAVYSTPALLQDQVPDALVPLQVFGGFAIAELVENIFRWDTGLRAQVLCVRSDGMVLFKCEPRAVDGYTNALLEMSTDPEGKAVALVDGEANVGAVAPGDLRATGRLTRGARVTTTPPRRPRRGLGVPTSRW